MKNPQLTEMMDRGSATESNSNASHKIDRFTSVQAHRFPFSVKNSNYRNTFDNWLLLKYSLFQHFNCMIRIIWIKLESFDPTLKLKDPLPANCDMVFLIHFNVLKTPPDANDHRKGQAAAKPSLKLSLPHSTAAFTMKIRHVVFMVAFSI